MLSEAREGVIVINTFVMSHTLSRLRVTSHCQAHLSLNLFVFILFYELILCFWLENFEKYKPGNYEQSNVLNTLQADRLEQCWLCVCKMRTVIVLRIFLGNVLDWCRSGLSQSRCPNDDEQVELPSYVYQAICYLRQHSLPFGANDHTHTHTQEYYERG